MVVYLFLGLFFGLIYRSLEVVSPGAFYFNLDEGNEEGIALQYFSFVVLTTLGFGEIVPQTNVARTIVVLQALLGQVFLVVIVSQLVSMRVNNFRIDEKANNMFQELKKTASMESMNIDNTIRLETALLQEQGQKERSDANKESSSQNGSEQSRPKVIGYVPSGRVPSQEEKDSEGDSASDNVGADQDLELLSASSD